MKSININNDAEILKKKHITSPDVSKMKFRYQDPKQKVTVFFATAEKRDAYIDRVVNGIEPEVSSRKIKVGNPKRK